MDGSGSTREALKAIQHAETLFVAGRLAEAEPAFAQVEIPEAAATTVHLRLGQLAAMADRCEEAEAHLFAAARLSPEVHTLGPLADLYRRVGDYSRAAAVTRAVGRESYSRVLDSFGDGAYRIVGDAGACPLKQVGSVPLVAIDLEDGQHHFILDTGADETVIDHTLADELGIARLGGETGTHAGGRPLVIEYGRLDEIGIGALRIRDIPVQIQPLRARFAPYVDGLRVDGVVGSALLYHFRARIGPEHLTLVRGDGSGDRDEDKAWLSLLLAGAHLPIVPACLGGDYCVPALLDTGQTGFDFAAALSVARAIGGTGSAPLFGEGAAGGVPVFPFTPEELTVGRWRKPHPSAVCIPQFPLEYRFGFRIGGLIGNRFLGEYRIDLDFPRLRMRLVPLD